MKKMQLEQAKEIYQAKYWDKLRCDELPDGVDYSAFDFGVNSGVIRSAKLLQKFVGVEADGIIGPASVKAVQNYQDKIFLITEFNNRRLAYLKGLHHWKTYGRGWTTRVNKVKAISLDMLGTPA